MQQLNKEWRCKKKTKERSAAEKNTMVGALHTATNCQRDAIACCSRASLKAGARIIYIKLLHPFGKRWLQFRS